MEELKGLMERVLREEVAKSLKTPPPQSLREFLSDPSSQQYSASRLCFILLILAIIALDGMAVALGLAGKLPDAWVPHLTTMNTVALASVAGVYGFNSVAGAFEGSKTLKRVKRLLKPEGGDNA